MAFPLNIRLFKPVERHPNATFHEASIPVGDSRNVALRRVTILIVTLFWLSQFAASSLFMQLNSPSLAPAALLPRTIVCTVGILITLGCIALQDRWRDWPLRVRAYWAIAFTVISSALLSGFNRIVFDAFLGPTTSSGFWAALPMETITRLWVFGSVYAMSLAVSYSIDVREREEEIVGLRALAQDAQIRALRSQLNPHFLFNALNSIVALIGDGQAKQAEAITEDLADFLRITLSLDPQRQITIAEEVSLQRTYLDIQKVRFPTRLGIDIDIAPEVEGVLVPNLILQPLIENSVKYAVARSTTPVTIRVSAHSDGDELQIIVEDDGGNAASPGSVKGNRMGLANVAERLAAHYGNHAHLSSGPRSNGGFGNSIVIPLRKVS